VTSLAAKLAEGPTESWEFTTWVRGPRKHLGVAASIAMRSATGNLRAGAEISQDIRGTLWRWGSDHLLIPAAALT
jgi:hypothetical protein